MREENKRENIKDEFKKDSDELSNKIRTYLKEKGYLI